MRSLVPILRNWLLALGLVGLLGGFVPPQEKAIDPCRIFGRIYLSDRIDGSFMSVYFEEYANMGDLEVFVWDNPLMADQSGFWCFVDNPYMADYILYMETSSRRADLRVHLTDIESLAGCR